jgi:hypothetical protein
LHNPTSSLSHHYSCVVEVALAISSSLLTIFFLSLSFHSLLQTDDQTSGAFPLTSGKRSKDVTIDESANKIVPPASADLELLAVLALFP